MYVCADQCVICPRSRVAVVREDGEGSKRPTARRKNRNGTVLKGNERTPRGAYRVSVSKVAMSRDMEEITKCLGEVVTIVFPKTVRRVLAGAFQNTKHLRVALMNEGLEALGTGDNSASKKAFGVFQNSAVQRVVLPSTLREIGNGAFEGCKNLGDVRLPEGLEKLGRDCFYESGLEEVMIPDRVTEIPKGAFGVCESLKLWTNSETNAHKRLLPASHKNSFQILVQKRLQITYVRSMFTR